MAHDGSGVMVQIGTKPAKNTKRTQLFIRILVLLDMKAALCVKNYDRNELVVDERWLSTFPGTRSNQTTIYPRQETQIQQQDLVLHKVHCWIELLLLGADVTKCVPRLPSFLRVFGGLCSSR